MNTPKHSNKELAIIGAFLLVVTFLYPLRFLGAVSDHKTQGILLFAVSILGHWVLAYLLKEPNVDKVGFRYAGDGFISFLPLLAMLVSIMTDNRVIWLCSMAVSAAIIAVLAHGHVRAVNAAIQRAEAKKKNFSPFLAGIFVSNMNKELLLKIVDPMKSEEKEATTTLRISSSGTNEWVLSFPQGVSVEAFMDTILGICLDIDLENHIEYPTGNHGVIGYYQFIDGPMEGKTVMFICGEEYEFAIVDNDDICYTDTTRRRRWSHLFRKQTLPFTQTTDNGTEYIPINLPERISKGSVLKQIRIDDPFSREAT